MSLFFIRGPAKSREEAFRPDPACSLLGIRRRIHKMINGLKGESQSAVTVRKVDSIEEMHVVVELQRQIWGYGSGDTDYPYPARGLLALASSGGLVSMAFLGEEPVGFAMAWLGRSAQSGKIYLHSQLLGVIPLQRGKGIGVRLKCHQREYALNEGIGLIGWTYDPLRASNAYFNLHKLGAVTRHYLQDYYGEVRSSLSLGQTSDRLWADWHIRSERVSSRLQVSSSIESGEHFESALETRIGEIQDSKVKVPVEVRLDHVSSRVSIEIPTDFDRIRMLDAGLADAWRQIIRKGLTHYLSTGYVADGFSFHSESGFQSAFYHLSRTED